jgi:hypothetical protein
MEIFKGLRLSNSKTEAGWHKSIQGSFLVVPRGTQMVASDDLIIELYREVFFKTRSEGGLKRIDPEEIEDGEPVFTDQEKYSLYMSRGRKKQTSNSRLFTNFYTPLYPSLARKSWFRKQQERTIKDFFLKAIAQHLHGGGSDSRAREMEFINVFYDALLGKRNGTERGDDVAGLKIDELNGCVSEEEGRKKLADLCGVGSHDQTDGSRIFRLQSKRPDDLAKTLFQDLEHLCQLEGSLDRLQWMGLFKTFLRFSSSVWLLAQMKMTIVLRDKLLSILSGLSELDIDESWVDEVIQTRHKGLFKPTMTLTNQIEKYIQQYVKARIELNILVALVEKYSGDDWSHKNITLHSGSQGDLGVLDLMTKALSVRNVLEVDLKELSLRVVLTRYCERFSAWSSPVLSPKQPAKGYSEYVRVLRKMEAGDEDGGYLVIPSKRKNAGYKIFPGNLMLKLVTFLAEQANPNKKLVFADIEDHFKKYGLDFGEKGEIRPKLIESLQDMGLLRGSPDAGDSVAVNNPYPIKN